MLKTPKSTQVGFADLSEWPYKDSFQAMSNELYGFVLCNPFKFFDLLIVSMLSPQLLSTLCVTLQGNSRIKSANLGIL